MITDAINRLHYLCDTLPVILGRISEEMFTAIPAPGKWSRKQVLGHLIDSATNNHHRFIRAQFEDQHIATGQLIAFWELYNRQLAALLQQLPPHRLKCEVNNGSGVLDLSLLAEEYVSHLEHHLRQITAY